MEYTGVDISGIVGSKAVLWHKADAIIEQAYQANIPYHHCMADLIHAGLDLNDERFGVALDKLIEYAHNYGVRLVVHGE